MSPSSMIQGTDIPIKRLRWIWRGYFPRGGFMLMEGDPSATKTTLLMHVAARITRNEPVIPIALAHDEKALRSRFKKARKVLVFCREESAGSVLRPRFEAAGGNSSMFWLSREPGHFPEMLHIIEKEILRRKPGMVILDPITEYLVSRTEQDARTTLEALAALAEEHDVLIVGLRHFTKHVRGSALYAGVGSYALTATARVQMLVARAPDEPGTRVLIVTKNNHVREEDRPSMRFALDETAKGDPFVRFVGECDVTEHDVMAARKSTKHAIHVPSQREKAMDVLLDILSSGPVRQREVEDRAGMSGVSLSTLKRARKQLRMRGYVIVAQKRTESDGDTAWWWVPPTNPPAEFVGRGLGSATEPPPYEGDDPDPEAGTDLFRTAKLPIRVVQGGHGDQGGQADSLGLLGRPDDAKH